jgi:ketosteroid isomerase-like protein
MPSWIVDDPTNILIILALLALALGGLWWVRRGDDFGKKKLNWFTGLITFRLTPNQCCAMGLTLIGLLVVAILSLHFFVPTDQKRIERAIREMSAAVGQRNVDRIFAHVSDQFSLAGKSKSAYRPEVENYIRHGNITEVPAWGFEQARFSENKREAVIEFMIKPKGSMTEGVGYRCLATFVKEPDGEWRLQTFRVFQPEHDPATAHPIYPH